MREYCGNCGGEFRNAAHPMTSPIYLTPREVADITGKQRYRAQARALARMGVHFLTRPDSRPIVSRLAFESAMGNDAAHLIEAEPNFEALDVTQTQT